MHCQLIIQVHTLYLTNSGLHLVQRQGTSERGTVTSWPFSSTRWSASFRPSQRETFGDKRRGFLQGGCPLLASSTVSKTLNESHSTELNHGKPPSPRSLFTHHRWIIWRNRRCFLYASCTTTVLGGTSLLYETRYCTAKTMGEVNFG